MNTQAKVQILEVDTERSGRPVRRVILLRSFKVTVTEQIRVVVDVDGPGVTVKAAAESGVVDEDAVGSP